VTLVLILFAVVCLAYANGANDNFKGVATLFGSGTTDYRGALTWATVTTFLGSLTAVFLAGQLLKAFSGKGLVADELVGSGPYVAAVALAAGATVLLATRIGMPISTTHGLIGALLGAGWAAGSSINLSRLAGTFLLPLAVSPIMAIAVTTLAYRALHALRVKLGASEATCVCVGTESAELVPVGSQAAMAAQAIPLSVTAGSTEACLNRYQGSFLGIPAVAILDRAHYLSAGLVSFARGLNDTPKIAALLLIAPAFGGWTAVAVVAASMAIGAVLSARKVAELISRKITPMNHGQGFTANLVTGLIVIGASRLGMPVSTTHVSCGSLFGLGAVTRQGRLGVIGQILLAWVVTLPVAAGLGAGIYLLASRV